jgi:hypothetical protein
MHKKHGANTMFIDLVKAKKNMKKPVKDNDEMSDERLDEIMGELFGTADKEQTKKGAGYKDKDRQEMLMRAEDEDEELDETEDEDEDEIEKALDKKERRAMMSKVYSMVDDLSDSELESFLNNREMKKAQVMAIFDSMSDSDLHDFVSASDANGEGMKIAMNKGEQDQMNFEDMDDEDMDKGSDYKMINGQELERALEMLGIKVNR